MTRERVKAGVSASKLAKISAPEFELARTIDSGQTFHWHPLGDGWLGTIGDVPVYVSQREDSLLITKGTEGLVREYFALGHSLDEIYGTFPKDADMQAALDFSKGISILKQPAWECLATFITSSMKQVIHIRQMSLAIRKTYGKKVIHNGFKLFTYPSPERLAEVDELELRVCKLGFRAKNLIGAARMIADGKVDLQRIESMDDAEALAELCKLPGVGEKVANCVLLFGYARLRAFPIDVWIERVLREIYFKGKRKVTTQRLKLFAQEYFGPYGGYAQQYLFHYARKTYRKRAGS
jgi:N-glycosylase/DNA lyase